MESICTSDEEGNPVVPTVLELADEWRHSTESESDVYPGMERYPDQFWRHHSLGNVREKPFSSIWSDEKSTVGIASKPQNTFKRTLRALLWKEICNGNFGHEQNRFMEICKEDPVCYLTEDEISNAI